MRLLLDTHAILWMVSGDPRLPMATRELMQRSTQLIFSPISFWEMAIKQSLGRADFQLGKKWASRIESELRFNSAIKLDLEIRHCERVETLPWHHRDPFDRLLIAQAMEEDLTLLSRDRRFHHYDLAVAWDLD